jgi:phospho-N-acetylmuramoyl-pentapeptide-transferase
MLYWIHDFFKDRHVGMQPDIWDQITNVFRYETFRAIMAGLVALIFVLLVGNKVILKLLSLKMGQPIRTAEEVNKLYALHEGKKGTPTMGGIMIVLAFVVAIAICGRWSNQYLWITVGVTVALGVLGFWDDYLKVAKKNSKGVSERSKLLYQFVVATAAATLIYLSNPKYFGELWIPFVKSALIVDMGWWTIPFFVVVIIGASNAVNLTDGLDGLATGCTLPVAFTYGIFNYLHGRSDAAEYLRLPHDPLAADMAIAAFSLLGAALGFLWFNCAPARVFMGDTGALAIGGAIAIMAISCKQEVTLVIVGGVFVVEAASVILQRSYFKYTKKKYGEGRRIFRMSPLHHHFELCGWKETQVVVRFWIVGIICAFIGLATLKLR